jgi:geranylgeranyl pyrophosphate synthase
MKKTEISPEEAMKQIQKIFKKRGTKALEMARKEMLQAKIECKEAREALTYFMTEYWHDLARPALLSLVCEAVGGDPNSTTPIAVPMILISGAIDIHDDIIDQSKTKMGRPTVYGKFGKDIALLVGDALFFKGFSLLQHALNKVSTSKQAIIQDIILDAFFQLGDAEASELPLRGQLSITSEEYLNIVRKKAADVEAYTRISALLGCGSSEEIDALGRYGRILGMMVILRDDWMDMTDLDEALQRIQNESLPLPIITSLENQKTRPLMRAILQKNTKTKRDAKKILEIARRTGQAEHLRRMLKDLYNEAHVTIENVKKNKEYLNLLVKSIIPSIED